MLMASAHLVLQPQLPKGSSRPVVRHMIHRYKYFFDPRLDFQDSDINSEDGTNTSLGSLNPRLFFITPSSVFMNTHIQFSSCLGPHAELLIHTFALSFCVVPLYWKADNVWQKPIRAGFVLVQKSLHKGQSLRVALGEVCAMEKCSQSILLSCH